MTQGLENTFGYWRRALWPVYRQEAKNFLPMFLMLFCICFNYSILRNLKDALVVTARASGAEVIPFIKVWVMLPCAILGMVIYTKLSYRFSQERVFYLIVSTFVCYFAFFAFFLYPARAVLHPHHTADILTSVLPVGFKGFIAMYRNWTFTLFYTVSELWGCIVLNVLFWSFANQVTSLGQAKRFYGVFHIGSNLGTIAAGRTSVMMCPVATNAVGAGVWDGVLTNLLIAVLIGGITTMVLFRWANRHVTLDPWVDQVPGGGKAKKKKSLRESLAYLSQSKYLIFIATMVISYNLVINLVEVIWKDRLHALCPNPVEFNRYMNHVTTIVGVVSTITAVFMSVLIRRMGWGFTATITPIVVAVTSGGFFAFLFFDDSLGAFVASLVGTTPLTITVFFGALQNSLSKAGKYSVFDTTKEMAFIPLDRETKLKGKAAIDGVGSRLGKSGGSLITQGLLVALRTLTACAPYVVALLSCVIVGWLYAVRGLAKRFMVFSDQDAAAAAEQEVQEPDAEPLPELSTAEPAI